MKNTRKKSSFGGFLNIFKIEKPKEEKGEPKTEILSRINKE
jgi:hypothetical protein